MKVMCTAKLRTNMRVYNKGYTYMHTYNYDKFLFYCVHFKLQLSAVDLLECPSQIKQIFQVQT